MEKKRQVLGSHQRMKKLWNMTVMLILIEIGALGTVQKTLEKRPGRVDNLRKN